MSIQESQIIWHNGEMKPWHEATTHVLTHGLHYGSSVFEGIRVYRSSNGPVGFRLAEHMHRLYESAKIHRINIPYNLDELIRACHDLIVENDLDSAYLRPIAYRGYGSLGVVAGPDVSVDVAIAAITWGAYLGEEGLEKGIDVCVSSWQRLAPNTIPALAKAGGNYLSSQLISMEAKRLGFAEGIGLTVNGTLSEGAGENLFLVKNGELLTPPQTASVLSGITRDSVIQLAADLGIVTREADIPREMLYLADELFFTGTAAEITPIRSVDGIAIGNGSRGSITQRLQQAFFGLFDGSTTDSRGWLEPINGIKQERGYHVPSKIAV